METHGTNSGLTGPDTEAVLSVLFCSLFHLSPRWVEPDSLWEDVPLLEGIGELGQRAFFNATRKKSITLPDEFE